MTNITWISSTMSRGRAIVDWAIGKTVSPPSLSGHDGYADEHAPSTSGCNRDNSLRRTGCRDNDRHSTVTGTEICLDTTQIDGRTDEMTAPETENSTRT